MWAVVYIKQQITQVPETSLENTSSSVGTSAYHLWASYTEAVQRLKSQFKLKVVLCPFFFSVVSYCQIFWVTRSTAGYFGNKIQQTNTNLAWETGTNSTFVSGNMLYNDLNSNKSIKVHMCTYMHIYKVLTFFLCKPSKYSIMSLSSSSV